MKKIREFLVWALPFIFLSLMVLCMCQSCGPKKYDYTCTITYRIYYPGNTITKSYTYECTEKGYYNLGSDRGSNYLYLHKSGVIGAIKLEDTSAPIEIVSFDKHKKY